MSVKEFEIFHGIVLTKLVRCERPVALSLIETRGDEWACYKINEAVFLFVKHSTSRRKVSRGGGGYSWSFVFNVGQMQQMAAKAKEMQVYIALVCGNKSFDTEMQVCLLEPSELHGLLDFSVSVQQAITVRYHPGKNLRIFKDRKEKLLVPQGRLDTWDVPGN
ncbi:MAG: hypothetical protein AB1894_27650 [Chloroflexota bacterium]